MDEIPCRACGGTGWTGAECAWCKGTGYTAQSADADELARLRADVARLIAAWPETADPHPGDDLLVQPATDPAGRRMYGDDWPRVKADIVWRMFELGMALDGKEANH